MRVRQACPAYPGRRRSTSRQRQVAETFTLLGFRLGECTVGWLSDPNAWIGLLTLTSLESVLGVDNIIFISILAGTLPAAQQPRARRLGLLGAFCTRILLLLSIAW